MNESNTASGTAVASANESSRADANAPSGKVDDVVIKASGLHKRFVEGSGDEALDVHVLQGVDLVVGRGETIAIVGASGSGKSTLLHLMGGLEAPSEGTVELNGRDFAGMSPAAQGEWRNASLGFI
jgi:lipoprotein-releasing system ATP-binding protein